MIGLLLVFVYSAQHMDAGETRFVEECPHVLTELSRRPRSNVELVWTAPASRAGCIEFRCVSESTHAASPSTYTGWAKKVGPQTHDYNIAKWILKILPHLAYVATLPCGTLMSAKQAINDKLQGSVATYLSSGRVFNN